MPRASRPLTAIAATLLTGLLAACGSTTQDAKPTGETREVTHAQGSTTVPKDPRRIVIIDFGAADTVEALGAADRVVGIPKKAMPAFLPVFKDGKYTDVGTLSEPNLDTVASLKPDLIIAGPRIAAKYGELSKIAPTVDVSLAKGSLVAAGKKQDLLIADLLGRRAEAEKAHAALDAKVAQAAAKSKTAGPGLILMTSGGKVAAFGPGSRFGLIHDDLGVPQAMQSITQDRHGMAVSFEAIHAAKPQRLFVVDRDAAIGKEGKAAQAILDNKLVNDTPAWKNQKVVYLDGQRWYVAGSGLRNLPAMVDQVASGLA